MDWSMCIMNYALKSIFICIFYRAQGLFSFTLSLTWVSTTLAICLVLFPLVDPIIYTSWHTATQQLICLLGDPCIDIMADKGLAPVPLPNLILTQASFNEVTAPMNPELLSFKDTVVKCVSQGDFMSLALHFTASGLIGPIWEEVSHK